MKFTLPLSDLNALFYGGLGRAARILDGVATGAGKGNGFLEPEEVLQYHRGSPFEPPEVRKHARALQNLVGTSDDNAAPGGHAYVGGPTPSMKEEELTRDAIPVSTLKDVVTPHQLPKAKAIVAALLEQQPAGDRESLHRATLDRFADDGFLWFEADDIRKALDAAFKGRRAYTGSERENRPLWQEEHLELIAVAKYAFVAHDGSAVRGDTVQGPAWGERAKTIGIGSGPTRVEYRLRTTPSALVIVGDPSLDRPLYILRADRDGLVQFPSSLRSAKDSERLLIKIFDGNDEEMRVLAQRRIDVYFGKKAAGAPQVAPAVGTTTDTAIVDDGDIYNYSDE